MYQALKQQMQELTNSIPDDHNKIGVAAFNLQNFLKNLALVLQTVLTIVTPLIPPGDAPPQ